MFQPLPLAIAFQVFQGAGQVAADLVHQRGDVGGEEIRRARVEGEYADHPAKAAQWNGQGALNAEALCPEPPGIGPARRREHVVLDNAFALQQGLAYPVAGRIVGHFFIGDPDTRLRGGLGIANAVEGTQLERRVLQQGDHGVGKATALHRNAADRREQFPFVLRLGDGGVDLAEGVIQPGQADDFFELLVLGSDVGNYADEAIAPALRVDDRADRCFGPQRTSIVVAIAIVEMQFVVVAVLQAVPAPQDVGPIIGMNVIDPLQNMLQGPGFGLGFGHPREVEEGLVVEQVVAIVVESEDAGGNGLGNGGVELFAGVQGLQHAVLLALVAEHQYHTADGPILAGPDGGAAIGDGMLAAIAGNQQCVVGQPDDLAFRQHQVDRAGDGFPRLLIDDAEDFRHRSAVGLGRGPAGEFLRQPVHHHHVAAGVGGEHRIADALQGDTQIFLAQTQVCQHLFQIARHVVEGFDGGAEIRPADHRDALRELARAQGAASFHQHPQRPQAMTQHGPGAEQTKAYGNQQDLELHLQAVPGPVDGRHAVEGKGEHAEILAVGHDRQGSLHLGDPAALYKPIRGILRGDTFVVEIQSVGNVAEIDAAHAGAFEVGVENVIHLAEMTDLDRCGDGD